MASCALLLPLWLLAQDPVPWPEGDEELRRQAAEIASSLQSGWNLDLHGFLRTSFFASGDVDIYPGSDAAGVSLDSVRLWVDSELEDWHLRLGVRGETGSGRTFFGVASDPSLVRQIDATLSREIADEIWVTVGRFRPPFISSGMRDEDELLFYDRTFIGTDWDFYRGGAMVHGRYGQLRGWLSAQNGTDGFGEGVAWTLRGMWDVLGEGSGYDREGAYGAAEELGLSVGGALYYDTETDNASAQAIEVRLTAGEVSLGGEVVDKGDGLGDLYSWAAMASWLFADDLELGLCVEDFDRDDGTDLARLSLTWYAIGEHVKVQAVLADADSNAPLAEAELVLLGLTAAF
jgi:hypothetical protein